MLVLKEVFIDLNQTLRVFKESWCSLQTKQLTWDIDSGLFFQPRNMVRNFLSTSVQLQWEIIDVKIFGLYVMKLFKDLQRILYIQKRDIFLSIGKNKGDRHRKMENKRQSA